MACYSGYFKEDAKDQVRAGMKVIPAGTPPILLAHASDDDAKAGGSDVENTVFMYVALHRAGIPTEMHVYATGGHDFGVRQNEKLPSSWTGLALRWLRAFNLLTDLH
jgi:dipeptidyl aminopeptidase/acylaminoacyl peptidase